LDLAIFHEKIDYLFAATSCGTQRQASGARALALASCLAISLQGGRQCAAYGENSA